MKHNIGTRARGIGGKVSISIVEYNHLKATNERLVELLKECDCYFNGRYGADFQNESLIARIKEEIESTGREG